MQSLAGSHMKIRKQVYDLTPADFDLAHIWEFASDEEGVDGQDEATVRPVESAISPDSLEGMFVAKARFVLADGTTMGGYLTPGMPGELDLGRIQPAVVTEKGQVSFWCGMVEPTKEYIEASYKILGKQPGDVFPLFFSSEVPFAGATITGTVPGFIVLLDFQLDTTKVIR
jgi:hypothetical protein